MDAELLFTITTVSLYLALAGLAYWGIVKLIRAIVDPAGEFDGHPPPSAVRWVAAFIALFAPGFVATVLHSLLRFAL